MSREDRQARRAERRSRRATRRATRREARNVDLPAIVEYLVLAAERLLCDEAGADKRAWVIDRITDVLCLPSVADDALDALLVELIEAACGRLFGGEE